MNIDVLEHVRNTSYITTVEQEIVVMFNRERLAAKNATNEKPSAAEINSMRALCMERGLKNADIAISVDQRTQAFRIHVVPAQPKPATKKKPAASTKKGARR